MLNLSFTRNGSHATFVAGQECRDRLEAALKDPLQRPGLDRLLRCCVIPVCVLLEPALPSGGHVSVVQHYEEEKPDGNLRWVPFTIPVVDAHATVGNIQEE